MLEQLLEFFAKGGFWGTRAPMGMDIAITLLVLLWLMLYNGKPKPHTTNYRAHGFYMRTVGMFYWVMFFAIDYWLYIGHIGLANIGSLYLEKKGCILFHLFSFVYAFSIWLFALKKAKDYSRRRALPGLYSKDHKSQGRQALLGLALLTVSELMFYYCQFVYVK